MSLLLFMHHSEGFAVITDTLATTDHGKPYQFLSKCWPFPHMKLLVAGTGLAPFTEAWFQKLQSGILARDVDMLNLHAPTVLRQLWLEAQGKFPDMPADATATIYHFGFPEDREGPVRYTYRSTDNFVPEEQLEEGFGVRPQPISEIEQPTNVDGIVLLAHQLRAEQASLPVEERIFIGGELCFYSLDKSGVSSSIIYRFDDYDQMWNDMCSLHSKAAPS